MSHRAGVRSKILQKVSNALGMFIVCYSRGEEEPMSSIVRRGLTIIVVVIACGILGLWSYWAWQRHVVYEVAQSGLNNTYHTTVHITKLELDDVGGFSKWFIMPFRRHDWFALYKVPQGNHTVAMVNIGQIQAKWVYVKKPPYPPHF
jgi:hypothetical protein